MLLPETLCPAAPHIKPLTPSFFLQKVLGAEVRIIQALREAHYDSVHGRIVSERQRKDKQLALHVVIPANTTATIYVPAGDAASVQESGKPAAKAVGVHFVGTKDTAAVFEVGSGTYDFTTSM